MKRPILLLFVGVICGLLAATGVLFASAAGERLTASPPGALDAASLGENGEFTVHTGQTFCGLHLQGVIPCSSMVVKGGGHLVIITRDDRPFDNCSYHVKQIKRIELNGKTIDISVVGEDTIRATLIKPALAARS